MTLRAHLIRRVGDFELDAAFTISDGEVLALLGPNGSGKSTVIRCLAGLAALDDGQVVIDDVVVDEPSSKTFVQPPQRAVGVVFQRYVLFDHMSVIENVAFGLRARKMDGATARGQAMALLERFDVDELAQRRPSTLSGGQAQRVALARALAINPRVVLLDEPLAALDAGTKVSVRRDLRDRLASFGGSRLLVTHDPVDAYTLADRVAVIEHGTIVQIGTLSEVTARPRSRYVADLLGVNLLRGWVRGSTLTTSNGAHVVVADAPSGDCYAVVRPQGVAIVRSDVSGSSVRNAFPVKVVDVERLGGRARVSLDGQLRLIAEVTIEGLEALALRPGDHVWATVKATDVEVYPA